MSTIVLDTLEFATRLKAGGFTEQQAETQARALADLVEKQLSTKQDVESHEQNLRRDIETVSYTHLDVYKRQIRRCGELLKQVEASHDRGNQYRQHDGTVTQPTRTQAAKDAGLSERQKVTALRVANGEKSSRLAP